MTPPMILASVLRSGDADPACFMFPASVLPEKAGNVLDSATSDEPVNLHYDADEKNPLFEFFADLDFNSEHRVGKTIQAGCEFTLVNVNLG